jgi:hypothetical protein
MEHIGALLAGILFVLVVILITLLAGREAGIAALEGLMGGAVIGVLGAVALGALVFIGAFLTSLGMVLEDDDRPPADPPKGFWRWLFRP